MADGTEFIIDIPVNAGQADTAARSIDTLAQALERAQANASTATTAMQSAQAAYAQAETKADRAAKALEKINVAVQAQEGKLAKAMDAGDTASIARAEAALAALTQRQAEQQTVSSEANAALEQASAALDEQTAAAEQAAEAEAGLARVMSAAEQEEANLAAQAEETAARQAELAAESEGAGTSLNGMSRALGKIGGPAGIAGQRMAALGHAFSKLAAMGPAGIFIAVGVAAVAVVAGIVAAGAALLKFGIAQADAGRTSLLLSQGIAQSVEGGIALEQKINDLGAQVPLTADELRSMAADLAKTGLRGEALTEALGDAARKSAELKFGPEFAKQMLSLDVQSQRLKSNVGRIFGGLKIEGLLGALQKAGGLFEENSAAAKAIKVVFESLFQPIVDGATGMIPKVVSAFLQFEIWALKTLITLKPYAWVLRDIGTVVLAVGGFVVGTFEAMFAAVGFFIGSLQALYGAGSAALQALSGAMLQVREFLLSLSLSDVGMAMIDGLTGGLLSAGPKVLQAITGIANSAIQAAKKALGIASPSKVFATIGAQTAEGMETGVDAGSAGVSSALEGMVAPPDVAAPGGGGGGASVSTGGNTYNITVQVDGAGGGNGDDLAAKIVEGIRNYLESVSGEAGGMVPA